MPSWKKVIVSGSDASLNSLYAPSITGSLQGTASYATIKTTGSTSFPTIYSADPAAGNKFPLTGSVIIGQEAGYLSSGSQYLITIGYRAGYSTTDASYSTFLNHSAGSGADFANQSNFIGYRAGYLATYANNSNFIGYLAGQNQYSASYSTIIGSSAGRSGSWGALGANNIIIGTNISLPNGYSNYANIGGVLFISGTYGTTSGNNLTTPITNGRIGIGIVAPSASLHINNSSTNLSFLVEDDTNPDVTPFVIDTTGQVGIGTITPSASLHTTGSAIISGSMIIGSSSLGPSENTLTLGARDTTGEGGQLGLNASGGTYTSASMIDVWQNKFRVLRGTNAGSDATRMQIDLHTGQLNLATYTSTTAQVGTVVGILGFDAGGNILTTTSAGSLSGGATNYVTRWAGPSSLTTGSIYDTGTNVGIGNQSPSYKLDVTGDIRATGAIYANANGAMYFQGGDDAALYDINVANTMGIYGVQTVTEGAIKLGSNGAVLYGSGSKLGIGTTTPNSASLHVSGNVFASSYTGSLQGTASFATSASQAITASFALTASFVTGSNVFGPFGSNSIISASYAQTASISDRTTRTDLLVINQTGLTINKGVVVRISGSNNASDIPRITTASYESDAVSANTLGITSEQIVNGSQGYIITEGILTGLDTTGWSSGTLLFLGATGSITASAPQAPLHAVRLGQVIREQSNNGSIHVRIDNGYEIDELHDVIDNTTTSSYGDLLVKSGSVWTNSNQLTGSYGLTGSLTATSFTGSLFGTASYDPSIIKLSGSSIYSLIAPVVSNFSTEAGVYIGSSSGDNSVNAFASVFIGRWAGQNAVGTNRAVAIGQNAGAFTSGSIHSVFIGTDAGSGSVSSSYSNFIGQSAGEFANDTIYANFIGTSAGDSSNGLYRSNILGFFAGLNASSSYRSNWLGQQAGQGTTSSYDSNFFGYAAGYQSLNAQQANFIGFFNGYRTTGSINANFIGNSTGRDSTNASESIFMGTDTGRSSTGSYSSVYIGNQAGYQVNESYRSVFIGPAAGYQTTQSYSSNFIGDTAGYRTTGSYVSNFIGYWAGRDTSGSSYSNFMGVQSGNESMGSFNCNFIGTSAGYQASGSTYATYIGYQVGVRAYSSGDSVFIGKTTGYEVLNASQSVFIGETAGSNQTGSANSVFIGLAAGRYAGNTYYTNALGYTAGYLATGSIYSNFLGYAAGRNTVNSTYSNLIGYRAGYATTTNSIGSNNIIIGTNITLASGSKDSINIGGIIFGTGSYSTTAGNPYSGSATNGRIGIRTTNPNATLDVNGSAIISGSLTVTNDFTVLGSSSIQYISSSQLNISDNIITVNTFAPTFKFGGIAVIDSGSGTPYQSGSLLFDSEQNQWIFVHKTPTAAAITSSLMIMGPETYDAVGSEIHPTTNRIMKSVNDEHIGDSNITDTGTVVSINSATEITGSLTVSGSLRVGGIIFGDGGTQLSGSTAITGSTIISGSLTVTDNLGSGTTTVDMNALMQSSLLYLSNNF